jgi:Fic family protein
MTSEERDRRDSRALEPELITDPQAKAAAEARNGFRHTMLRLLQSTPIHLAAYLMWRLNWIHPFADGNGRTSRIISYVVLSIRAGAILPGTPTTRSDC